MNNKIKIKMPKSEEHILFKLWNSDYGIEFRNAFLDYFKRNDGLKKRNKLYNLSMRIRLIIILCLFSGTLSAYDYQYIRDGRIFIRGGNGDTITIAYEEIYMASSHKDYVYFQSPGGEMLQMVELGFDNLNGSFELYLNAGQGDYIITFPSQTYRRYTVSIPDMLKSVYEPPRFYMNCRVEDGFKAYFKVPEGISSFSILGRRDHNSQPAMLQLYAPGDELQCEFLLPIQTQPGAYAPFDSCQITNPDPGFWCISIAHEYWAEKVAFWLDDIPNYFCLDTAHWFIPEYLSGTCSIYASGVAGPMGMIGGEVSGNPPEIVIENLEFMGLESNNYYINQCYREPENDNADPFSINWDAFNWNSDPRIEIYTSPPINYEMFSIIAPADWLPNPISTQNEMDELAEFYEVYNIHHNVENQDGMTYYTPIDEPNDKPYTKEGYGLLFETVANRKNESPYPEVRNTRLLAPSSSNFTNACGTGEFGVEWATYIYEHYDELVDGINFHIWSERSLLGSHVFADEIMAAHNIIRQYDSDGDTLETIVLEQTNINPGGGSSPYYVNSFYASLWWTGVVCNTMNTGYADAVNWFQSVDDSYHMKGYMYGPEKNYQLKAVGYTAAFLVDNTLDSVIDCQISHPEVDALHSFDEARSRCYILLSNKGERQLNCSIHTELPNGFPGGDFITEVWRTDSEALLPVLDSSFSYSGPSLTLEYMLQPKSIYSLRFLALPTSIGAIAQHPIAKIYPNPVKTTLNIEAPAMESIALYTPGGQECYAVTIGQEDKASINMEQLPAGIYILRVVTGNGVVYSKVIHSKQ